MARKEKQTSETIEAGFVPATANVVVLHDAHVQAFEKIPLVPTQEETTKQLVKLGRDLASIVGETEAKVYELQVSTELRVEDILTDMVNAGFSMDMFKKGQPVWEAITNEIQVAWGCHLNPEYKKYVTETRAAGHTVAIYASWAADNGKPIKVIPESTINNRRSAIRKFLQDKIDGKMVSLDLYQHGDRQAKADNAKKQVNHVTSSQDKKDDAKQDEKPTSTAVDSKEQEKPALKVGSEKVVNMKGALNMINAAILIVQQNQDCNVADRKYVEMFEQIVRAAIAAGDIAKPAFMK